MKLYIPPSERALLATKLQFALRKAREKQSMPHDSSPGRKRITPSIQAPMRTASKFGLTCSFQVSRLSIRFALTCKFLPAEASRFPSMEEAVMRKSSEVTSNVITYASSYFNNAPPPLAVSKVP